MAICAYPAASPLRSARGLLCPPLLQQPLRWLSTSPSSPAHLMGTKQMFSLGFGASSGYCWGWSRHKSLNNRAPALLYLNCIYPSCILSPIYYSPPCPDCSVICSCCTPSLSNLFTPVHCRDLLRMMMLGFSSSFQTTLCRIVKITSRVWPKRMALGCISINSGEDFLITGSTSQSSASGGRVGQFTLLRYFKTFFQTYMLTTVMSSTTTHEPPPTGAQWHLRVKWCTFTTVTVPFVLHSTTTKRIYGLHAYVHHNRYITKWLMMFTLRVTYMVRVYDYSLVYHWWSRNQTDCDGAPILGSRYGVHSRWTYYSYIDNIRFVKP